MAEALEKLWKCLEEHSTRIFSVAYFVVFIFILSRLFDLINTNFHASELYFKVGVLLIFLGFGAQIVAWIASIKGDTAINIVTIETAKLIVIGGIIVIVLGQIGEMLPYLMASAKTDSFVFNASS